MDTANKIFVNGEITGTETTIKPNSMLVVVEMDTTPPVGKVFVNRFIQRMSKCVELALKEQGGWVTDSKTIIAMVPEQPLEGFFDTFISLFLEHVSKYIPKDPLPDNQSDQVILQVMVSYESTVTNRKIGLKFTIPRSSN
jgi:hypothetical protein